MKFLATYSYDESLGVLFSKAKGVADPGDILALYNKLHSLANRHQCRKALVDLRQVQLSYDSASVLSTLDSLEPLLCNLQIARIVKPTDARQQFVQAYAEQLNLPLRNFYQDQQGLAWLISSPNTATEAQSNEEMLS